MPVFLENNHEVKLIDFVDCKKNGKEKFISANRISFFKALKRFEYELKNVPKSMFSVREFSFDTEFILLKSSTYV